MNSLKRAYTGKVNLKKNETAQRESYKVVKDNESLKVLKAQKSQYFGNYVLSADKPLYYEFCQKIEGLGFSNCLVVLKQGLPTRDISKLKKITLQDLSVEESSRLEKLLETQNLNVKKQFTNRKKVSGATELRQADISFSLKHDSLIIGDLLKSAYAIDIRRLKSSKCYIGERHTLKRPVHGQQFRASGKARKMCGFQKQKSNSKDSKRISGK